MPKWLYSDANGDLFYPTNEENPSPVKDSHGTFSALVVAFVTFVFGLSFVYL